MRIALFLLVSVVLAGETLACSCIRGSDPVKAAGAQEVVFRGKVVATELMFADEDGEVFRSKEAVQDGRVYRVAVLQVAERFRGEIGPFVTMVTGSGGGDCGYSFQSGQSYLVYAYRTENAALQKVAGAPRPLTTNICLFTAPETESAETLEKLRAAFPTLVPMLLKE